MVLCRHSTTLASSWWAASRCICFLFIHVQVSDHHDRLVFLNVCRQGYVKEHAVLCVCWLLAMHSLIAVCAYLIRTLILCHDCPNIWQLLPMCEICIPSPCLLALCIIMLICFPFCAGRVHYFCSLRIHPPIWGCWCCSVASVGEEASQWKPQLRSRERLKACTEKPESSLSLVRIVISLAATAARSTFFTVMHHETVSHNGEMLTSHVPMICM